VRTNDTTFAERVGRFIGKLFALLIVKNTKHYYKTRTARAQSVDHNHETLKVRGLLCWRCNSGLGFFKDNQAHLAMAIEYLVKHDDAS
jgi:hypothetical protein